MIFRELSNAPFVFLYDDQEPRSWGRSNAPPPPPSQQAVENPEAQHSRARVKGSVSTDIGNMELWARD